MPPFDYSCVDWTDDDTSPFDQCDDQEQEEEELNSSSSCVCHYSSSVLSIERKRTIRFALEDQVLEIPNREDYSASDIQATWYNRHEFLSMRRQISHALQVLETNCERPSPPPRGLEYRTEEGARKRTLNKRDAHSAVLSEQEHQWRAGAMENPERIAANYNAVSVKCAGMALLAGVQDEQNVRDYLQDTRQELLVQQLLLHRIQT
jgi:hypothetical protein